MAPVKCPLHIERYHVLHKVTKITGPIHHIPLAPLGSHRWSHPSAPEASALRYQCFYLQHISYFKAAHRVYYVHVPHL